MCSWGSSTQQAKFYKGALADTPWNKDLLWRHQVAKEITQTKVHDGELPPTDATKRLRAQRMKMGVTGTLVPDVTPRALALASRPRTATSFSGRSRSSSIGSRSSLTASTSSMASTLSLQHRLEAKVEAETAKVAAATQRQLASLQAELREEARQRKAAERTIHLLCAKLNVRDQHQRTTLQR
ncbi:hypothetical protein SPRG_08321 [Saprolegnia parasitica CBS 223.65]|uniref:Uncharacterized protein n=1 Tax=Saprolegnia parasitica (strain CBS 223.65) TaxID=695850 RepID=A0A067CI92_SAPPC|nr:hypothetical protein SPRG_08321 [Saprolegnia parasitica CBS 223.65]KDO26246.1 hypothetical protein SPRG_08321 [Saprolegnia parasitica CBS 223.65]|eukprot:XP_012202955.1 hypothetical protein SPRG_08321 [Saprolegnia parasitica CBS 223.65]